MENEKAKNFTWDVIILKSLSVSIDNNSCPWWKNALWILIYESNNSTNSTLCWSNKIFIW
jgi:hypothetical protein